ncbi:MAG: hypothetical protein ACRDP8_21980 [Actinopolymorphaceae bacterium]
MSQDQMPTPEWDLLIAERGGRGPTEFDGHDTWDDSEEARQAYARGVAEAEATQAAFWGREEEPDTEPAAAGSAPAASTAAASAATGTSLRGSTSNGSTGAKATAGGSTPTRSAAGKAAGKTSSKGSAKNSDSRSS